MTDIYLGIGTNLGDKAHNLQTCLTLLEQQVGNLICCSSIYESEPVGFMSKNTFMNQVAHFQTTLSPLDLLRVTQQIEKDMGRTQKSEWRMANGECRIVHFDRIIDIDILLYSDLHQTFHDPDGNPILTIPHPRMQERPFVMIPLEEVENFAGIATTAQNPKSET